MDTYWTQLNDTEDQAILQFITGARSLDEWDDFCKEWHSQGGDEVLQLVQDYISK
jgi:multiple sugar transport system substrate-binding protein/putative aldouronate transport system substrate-binding protein